MTVNVPKKVQSRIQPKIDAGLCIIEGCDSVAKVRGLCPTCRGAARAAIDAGEKSEDKLIEQGMILPAKTPGRKRKNQFSKQLANSN